MLIRRLRDMTYTTAGDGTMLTEWLHPDREGLPPRTLGCSLAHAILPPGAASTPHILSTSTEVYVVLTGRGRLHVEQETADLEAGDAALIPAGAVQWVENTGADPFSFLALVSPPWRDDDELVLDTE